MASGDVALELTHLQISQDNASALLQETRFGGGEGYTSSAPGSFTFTMSRAIPVGSATNAQETLFNAAKQYNVTITEV